jgi:hypothetical protein
MRHIAELEARIALGFPIAVECDWNEPAQAERERFGHEWRVGQDDHFRIVK